VSEDLIAVAREQIEAFNADDWERMRSCLAPDSVYLEPGTQRRLEGADAILEVNEGWKAAYPDAKGAITDAFACGDRVAIQVTWEGTQAGPLGLPFGAEIPATSRHVTLQACQVMRIEEGKILEACHYFDMLGMLEQLGTISEDAFATAR
jgi:steroid delta-isomerase-like uncharacterized protein